MDTLSSMHVHHDPLNRSLERALEEAANTGELILIARKLREFPVFTDRKCDLSDTIIADLSRNALIEFPPILCSFFSLERLNLYHNAIKSIPDQISDMHLLKILDLSRNQLTFIPSPLCQLPHLEILLLNNNKILALPDEIGQLERLIELDVDNNELRQIPSQIEKLQNLRVLNIRRNELIELPSELCQLKLTHFDCSFNRLTHLPLNLRDMISLIDLKVDHNPLESPPMSICSLGLLHIMRYLLIEAMKEEKQRGLLTEHEINAKYRNSFSYQGSRHLQNDVRLRKSVIASDSGYLTTEGSEKTIGDDDSIISISNDHSLLSEPTLMLSLADEFSKELARQKADYEKKKSQAQQLKRHLLQQLGETENQRTKSRELARRHHDEKLAKIEKQRQEARRKMENSRHTHLTHYSSTEDDSTPLRSKSVGPIEHSSVSSGSIAQHLMSKSGFHTQPRRSEVHSDFTMQRQFFQLKENFLQIEQMRKMIESRLKITLPDDLGSTLSDGVVLCHFINQICPRSVPSIHVPSQTVPKLSLAKSRRNVENFLEASRRLGVPEIHLCTPQDLLEEKNLPRLARHIQILMSHNESPYEQTVV